MRVISIKKFRVCICITCVMLILAGAAYLRGEATDMVELPILMYHSILKDSSRTGKYIVTPQQVENDMEYLESHGYKCVSAAQVRDYVLQGGILPEKPYMLTFDDGNYNNLTYILPLLEKHDAYAVISIVGSYSEEFSDTGEANAAYSYLRWEDIRELSASGRVEIGNHSYDMHSIADGRIGSQRMKGEDSAEYRKKFTDDFLYTQQLLEDNCGIEPVIYTYPFGAYCDEAKEILADNGIIMTLTCNEAINQISRDPKCLYQMCRFNRAGGIRTEDFFERCGIK